MQTTSATSKTISLRFALVAICVVSALSIMLGYGMGNSDGANMQQTRDAFGDMLSRMAAHEPTIVIAPSYEVGDQREGNSGLWNG